MTTSVKTGARDNELLIRAKSTDNTGAVEELFHKYQDLLRSFANRYQSSHLAYEDAYQVAALGLLKALERFDPQRGTAFITFAYPTIMGELKKHYRDHVEIVRIPRRIRKLRRMVAVAQDEFRERSRREPTISELAELLGVPEEDVIETLATARNTYVLSLDLPLESDKGQDALLSFLGYQDSAFGQMETRLIVEQMMGNLPDRLREIMYLRLEGWTQKKIADHLKISQMEVSRLQGEAMRLMRESYIPERESA